MPWYFIPGVLILAKVKMYVRNNYDVDLENCEGVGKAHCVEMLNCH